MHWRISIVLAAFMICFLCSCNKEVNEDNVLIANDKSSQSTAASENTEKRNVEPIEFEATEKSIPEAKEKNLTEPVATVNTTSEKESVPNENLVGKESTTDGEGLTEAEAIESVEDSQPNSTSEIEQVKQSDVTVPSSSDKVSTKYVLNTNTKKIHFETCASAKKIADKNYAETYDYDGAIASGYKPCGNCKP